MRRLKYLALLLLLPTALTATAQDMTIAAQDTTVAAQDTAQTDTLSAFIGKNPNAVAFDVLLEGSRLYLSADDDFLLVNLSLAHPALQMRFLMQPATLYVDPTGRKKKTFEVALPSALDVKDELQMDTPAPGAEATGDERPDILPLIQALNKRGAQLRWGTGALPLGFQRFHVELDTQNDLINYYVLLPKEVLMQTRKLSDKWAVGIFSINDFANMPPPGQGDGDGMMPPPMEGEDREALQEFMQSDIRTWQRFSIDDVNNANLEE